MFHLGFQSRQDGRVHLADAAFGEIKREADFFHGHFFVVVQNENQTLGAAETFGQQGLHIDALNAIGWHFLAAIAGHIHLARFVS